MRGFARAARSLVPCRLGKRPLTLSLSPAYRGEGTRGTSRRRFNPVVMTIDERHSEFSSGASTAQAAAAGRRASQARPIGLVAIDLDGTLLNDSKRISEQTAHGAGRAARPRREGRDRLGPAAAHRAAHLRRPRAEHLDDQLQRRADLGRARPRPRLPPPAVDCERGLRTSSTTPAASYEDSWSTARSSTSGTPTASTEPTPPRPAGSSSPTWSRPSRRSSTADHQAPAARRPADLDLDSSRSSATSSTASRAPHRPQPAPDHARRRRARPPPCRSSPSIYGVPMEHVMAIGDAAQRRRHARRPPASRSPWTTPTRGEASRRLGRPQQQRPRRPRGAGPLRTRVSSSLPDSAKLA